MGHEFKIFTELNSDQKSTIKNILEKLPIFDKTYTTGNDQSWDFKYSNNKGTMPNFTISLETDGLYVCRYDTPNLWKDLSELRNYLDGKNIKFQITDYSD